jgi:hypothetical protein
MLHAFSVSRLVMVDGGGQGSLGFPVMLIVHGTNCLVHVFSISRLQFISVFASVDHRSNGTVQASGHLLVFTSLYHENVTVYTHREEGQFFALCRVGNQSALNLCRTIAALETGEAYFALVSFLHASTWIMELLTGKVIAHWRNRRYWVLHAYGGTFIVADLNDAGIYRVANTQRLELVPGAGSRPQFMSMLAPAFVGYIGLRSDGFGFYLQTPVRPALRMSYSRHTWLQACAM